MDEYVWVGCKSMWVAEMYPDIHNLLLKLSRCAPIEIVH